MTTTPNRLFSLALVTLSTGSLAGCIAMINATETSVVQETTLATGVKCPPYVLPPPLPMPKIVHPTVEITSNHLKIQVFLLAALKEHREYIVRQNKYIEQSFEQYKEKCQ